MIETFRVQNYKALRDVELKLTPMHVLIGPNDSGKTSILEALGALCRSVDEPLGKAFVGRWNGRDLVWGNSERSVFLEVASDPNSGEIRYKVECGFNDKDQNVRVLGEWFNESRLAEPHNAYQTNVMTIGSDPSSPHAAPPWRMIWSALSGVQYYRWNPRSLALPNAQDADRTFQLDHSGFGLALFLDDLLGADRSLFAKVEGRFKSIFSSIDSIIFRREKAFRVRHPSLPNELLDQVDGKGIYFKLANSGRTVPASQVSDGALLVLAYLAILYSPVKPRVLMVEEPENGIHPRRLKDVLSILREIVGEQTHTQVLMTTHSPYLLDEFKANEVTLCQKGSDGAVSVRQLSDVRAVQDQLDVFSLGEIWTAEGDEALARGDSNGAGGK